MRVKPGTALHPYGHSSAEFTMNAVAGFWTQAWATGKSPLDNLNDHLASPWSNNSRPCCALALMCSYTSITQQLGSCSREWHLHPPQLHIVPALPCFATLLLLAMSRCWTFSDKFMTECTESFLLSDCAAVMLHSPDQSPRRASCCLPAVWWPVPSLFRLRKCH